MIFCNVSSTFLSCPAHTGPKNENLLHLSNTFMGIIMTLYDKLIHILETAYKIGEPQMAQNDASYRQSELVGPCVQSEMDIITLLPNYHSFKLHVIF